MKIDCIFQLYRIYYLAKYYSSIPEIASICFIGSPVELNGVAILQVEYVDILDRLGYVRLGKVKCS